MLPHMLLSLCLRCSKYCLCWIERSVQLFGVFQETGDHQTTDEFLHSIDGPNLADSPGHSLKAGCGSAPKLVRIVPSNEIAPHIVASSKATEE